MVVRERMKKKNLHIYLISEADQNLERSTKNLPRLENMDDAYISDVMLKE